MSDSERGGEARRKAEAVLAQRKKREDEFVQQREKEREAVAAKVARLRELRLAKEAAEAQTKPKAQAPAKRRKSDTHGPPSV
jgi:hypothetical protein